MKAADYALLLLLGAIWGLSYVFIRVASPLLGPALLMGLRVAIASGITVVYIGARGQWKTALPSLRTRGWQYLGMGLLNCAIPFTLIAISELVINASYAAILNATTPVFSALAGAAWVGRPLTGRAGLGILIGVVGVIIAVGAAPFALSPLVLGAIVLSLCASVSYAFGAIYAHRHTAGIAPVTASLGQTIGGSLILVPFAAAEVPVAHWTAPGLVSLLGLAVLSTFVAYLLYFRILQNSGPTETLTVTFLIPIFGVVWGHVLLGEPIGVGTVVGLVVVLVGIGFVTGYWPGLSQRTAPASGNPTPPSPPATEGESPLSR